MWTFRRRTDVEPGAPNQESRGVGEKTHRLVWRAALILTLSMVLASTFLAFSDPASQIPQLGIGLTSFLVYTASLAVGAFLGFLFGLPRARVVDQATAAQPGTETHFLANSNLIKVSDWLTTILIGLTLVNLGEILPTATALGNALSAPLGSYDYSAAMGLTIAIGSVVAGFLLGYLWTSIRVRELLEEAEGHAAQRFLADLRDKTVDDAKALAKQLGLTLVVPPTASGASKITGQFPDPGTRIAPGEEIKLSI